MPGSKMTHRKFKDHWPAPNEYLLELGRMTTIWGTLESSVNLAISKFAGYESALDFRALIMVAHSNFQQRVDIVSALCEQLLPEYPRLKDYEAVIAKIQAAQKARNKFAHNAITSDEETGEVSVSYATARGSLKTKTEIVKLEAITDATAKIHGAMCALHTLVTGRELKPMWER
ncbi:MAG: hypothetical protein A2V83_06120 [Nitrospirae bacterium RBG_16_64_22]|nr:MAG: hypothetical protein A2V83_06120 [Nitrospirae bacterium RBG_16_64_22]